MRVPRRAQELNSRTVPAGQPVGHRQAALDDPGSQPRASGIVAVSNAARWRSDRSRLPGTSGTRATASPYALSGVRAPRDGAWRNPTRRTPPAAEPMLRQAVESAVPVGAARNRRRSPAPDRTVAGCGWPGPSPPPGCRAAAARSVTPRRRPPGSPRPWAPGRRGSPGPRRRRQGRDGGRSGRRRPGRLLRAAHPEARPCRSMQRRFQGLSEHCDHGCAKVRFTYICTCVALGLLSRQRGPETHHERASS